MKSLIFVIPSSQSARKVANCINNRRCGVSFGRMLVYLCILLFVSFLSRRIWRNDFWSPWILTVIRSSLSSMSSMVIFVIPLSNSLKVVCKWIFRLAKELYEDLWDCYAYMISAQQEQFKNFLFIWFNNFYVLKI